MDFEHTIARVPSKEGILKKSSSSDMDRNARNARVETHATGNRVRVQLGGGGGVRCRRDPCIRK
jgi:hypothetical protein